MSQLGRSLWESQAGGDGEIERGPRSGPVLREQSLPPPQGEAVASSTRVAILEAARESSLEPKLASLPPGLAV